MTFLPFCVVVFFVFLIAGFLFLYQGPHFVPSDDTSTRQIVEVAKKYGAKRILDMGSGDGKLVIALAKAGFDVDGVELDPLLVWRSRRALQKAGVTDKATVYWKSMWEFDVSQYDMIVVYVVQHVVNRLEKNCKQNFQRERM